MELMGLVSEWCVQAFDLSDHVTGISEITPQASETPKTMKLMHVALAPLESPSLTLIACVVRQYAVL